MDCRAFHTNLEDYLEGSLDFAGRFGIEKHAERCFLCGKEMADAVKLRAAARDFERVAAPRDFETAVLTKIQAEASARHSWQIWGWWNLGFGLLRPMAFAGAGLTLIAMFFATAQYWDDSQQQAPPVRRAAPVKSRPTIATPPSALRASTQTSSALTNRVQARVDAAKTGVDVAETRPVTSRPPSAVPLARPRTLTLQRDWRPESVEPFEPDYVELLVPGPDNRQILMRLPKTIRMESGQSSEEHFIRNVSH